MVPGLKEALGKKSASSGLWLCCEDAFQEWPPPSCPDDGPHVGTKASHEDSRIKETAFILRCESTNSGMKLCWKL